MSTAVPQAGGEVDEPAAVTGRMKQWAHRSAADYLGKYASSVNNLRKVIVRRAARRHPEIGQAGAAVLADEAVSFCREHAFVDDGAYAELKVRSGTRKGLSRRRIGAALAAKGVDAETASEALKRSDDLVAAVAFAKRRRIGPWRRLPVSPERRHKETGAMARNGFGNDITRKVLNMTLEEAEQAVWNDGAPEEK